MVQDTLIGALAKRKDTIKDLTVVSNNVGSGELGLGALQCGLLEYILGMNHAYRQASILGPN